MLSSVGLEVMDSINPQLNWKIVTKGRRSRTSVARRKLSAALSGEPTSGKTEHVPIKKRRHLLQSPSPQPQPSICCQDSSPQPYSSSPPFEDNDAYSSHFSVLRSAGSYSKWKLGDGAAAIRFGEGIDCEVLSEQAGGEHIDVEDFSGIELLAAAASMDDDVEKACKGDLTVENSLIPKSYDRSNLAPQFKQDSECNKSLSNETALEDDTNFFLVRNNLESATQSPHGCEGDGTATRIDDLKADRRHWDLNTLMDAWDEPYNDAIAGKTSKDVANDDMHAKGRQELSECQLLCNPGLAEDKFSDLKIKEDKLIAVSPCGVCYESPSLEETLREAANICHSQVTRKTSDQDTEKDVDYSSASIENISSPAGSVENIDSHAASAAKVNSHISFVENKDLAGASAEKIDLYHASAENVNMCPASAGKSDSHMASAEKVDSYMASAEKAESHIASAENVDSSMASAEKIDLDMTSAEEIGLTVDARHCSDICLDSHGHVVDSDEVARVQEGHDSPYEDGELRGSFLYPWEENEHVDYESDGRHGESSDVGELPGSEIVDGGSEGSHGSVRKSLLTKRFLGSNESNSKSVMHSYMHFMEFESENNCHGGKNESDHDLVTVENNEVKRKFSDQRDAVDNTVTHMDEYLLRTIQGKVQTCSKGRSSLDAFDGNDIFFMQQCRSRRLGGSDSHVERDMGPYKYLSRYRHATYGSEKGGADQWTYWGSKSRYTSRYQSVEGRNLNRPRRINGDTVDKFDRVEFAHKRQNSDYLSKGYLNRPFVRSSPVDRDDYFGVRRRMPLTQGIRENYPQGVGKKYEPLPDNTSKSVRLSPYLSSREQSFSPNPGRGVHIPLARRRSRSRSRTRSPMAWHSNRGRDLGSKSHIRSPDFRSEARMDRMKFPNSNSTLASDYREGYLSPPRGRFSPQRNGRWFDDLDFADSHLRRRRSPVRLFRRSQKFDAIGSSGRLKSDDYFKPTVRPGRFPFLANDDREGKFETDYEHRRRDDRGEVMHRRRDADDGGDSRRFRRSAEADVLETTTSNNKDDVLGTDPSNMPQR